MLATSLTQRQYAVDSSASATTILSCGDWALRPIVSRTSNEPHLWVASHSLFTADKSPRILGNKWGTQVKFLQESACTDSLSHS